MAGYDPRPSASTERLLKEMPALGYQHHRRQRESHRQFHRERSRRDEDEAQKPRSSSRSGLDAGLPSIFNNMSDVDRLLAALASTFRRKIRPFQSGQLHCRSDRQSVNVRKRRRQALGNNRSAKIGKLKSRPAGPTWLHCSSNFHRHHAGALVIGIRPPSEIKLSAITPRPTHFSMPS